MEDMLEDIIRVVTSILPEVEVERQAGATWEGYVGPGCTFTFRAWRLTVVVTKDVIDFTEFIALDQDGSIVFDEHGELVWTDDFNYSEGRNHIDLGFHLVSARTWATEVVSFMQNGED